MPSVTYSFVDTYEDEFFQDSLFLPTVSNIFSYSANIVYSGASVNISSAFGNINVIYSANAAGNASAATINIFGTYSNIFNDRIITFRNSGADETNYTVLTFSGVPNELYALTRYRPDLRNELIINHNFACSVVDDLGVSSNSVITITQSLLNNYSIGVIQMLNAIGREVKYPESL